MPDERKKERGGVGGTRGKSRKRNGKKRGKPEQSPNGYSGYSKRGGLGKEDIKIKNENDPSDTHTAVTLVNIQSQSQLVQEIGFFQEPHQG